MTEDTTRGGDSEPPKYADTNRATRCDGGRAAATESRDVWESPVEGVATGISKETDVPIPMRDGLELAGNVYRPEEPGEEFGEVPGEYPVIMEFTGWGKDIYWGQAQELFGEQWPGTGVGYEPWSPPVAHSCTFESENPNFWVPHGYVNIVVDGRGFGRSPGEFAGFEAWGRDMYDAIEWAARQPWSNGKVGMSGVSILSILQYYAAEANPPHLEAICPWQGAPDDLYRHGGIGPVTSPTSTDDFPVPNDPAWPAPEETNPPTPDPRSEDELFAEITQPALICGSWSSHGLFSRGDFRAFRNIASEDKWLYNHGREKWATFYETEAQAFRKRFFDHFLKGTDSRILDEKPVRAEVRDSLRSWSVRTADDFPLPETQYRTLHLDGTDRSLTDRGTPARASAVSYDATTTDSVAFEHTFEEETALVGYQGLKLWVAPEDAADADLFVTVRKLDRNGDEVKFHGYSAPLAHPVALGFLRLSHRTLNAAKSTRWEPFLERDADPEPVEPGDPVACQIPIRPSGTRYREGETLQVEVSGTLFGHEDMTETYPARKRGETALGLETINEGEHTIHTGGEYDSRLVIPEVPPEPPTR
ncbi:CocE/NonD family hydrolase [Halostagnicola sp. A-GB9-2]|uniref:CocE/NonD family hydrolase n=1 Tax=Halostagnicola sp. A-GB9-2 TaxID=3048066 RepID=UPI0024C0A7D5|nr:CocE/NonD family hydrolase [Halostagnicola sp. A-GB9-2]MDJ1434388.1 CocE/NonD family hydrolase [Halostagnicola sp. A-GB9-2]